MHFKTGIMGLVMGCFHMTCKQFKKNIFKIAGAKVTNTEIKTFNKHTETCERCRNTLLETIRGLVHKQLAQKR